MLVTVMNKQELWYIPSPIAHIPVDPLLIYTFAQPTLGIVEVEPEVFYVNTSSLYTSHESYLHRLDMRDLSLGSPSTQKSSLHFPRLPGGSMAVASSLRTSFSSRTVLLA